MRNAYEFHLEDADVHDVSRLDAMQQHVAKQVVFFEFAFREAGGEMRAVDRNVELLQQVRQRAEVIFVPVCKNDGGDVVLVFVKKTKIWDRHIDAIGRFLRKAHPGVENQHLVAVAQSHAIHSKLADTTERDDLEDASHKSQEYSMCRALTRMTRIGFHLYYPRYDQVSTNRVSPYGVCHCFRRRHAGDATGLLPHRRCDVGSF